MTTIKATIQGRRLELDVPADWPDGTEVEVHPKAQFVEPEYDWLDTMFMRYLETQADDSVTLEQVRADLAKIPGSLVEDFRRERDEQS